MPIPIKNLISNLIARDANDWRFYLLQHWQTIIGPVHTRICLEKIYGNTLVIGVYESHWLHELNCFVNIMISNINRHFEKPHVQQIRFKLIEVPVRPAGPRVPKKVESVESVVPLSHTQKVALIKIKDNELKEFLTEFWQRCAREN